MATGGRQRRIGGACTPDGWPASRSAGRASLMDARDLLDSGVTVRRRSRRDRAATHARRPGRIRRTSPHGPLTLHNVEIASDGHLRCTGTAATVSVYEAAALLQELLSAGAGAIPGALRYTLGRALLEVEAPPFDSRQQFSAALERFEDGPRAEVIAALHTRASSRDTTPADRRRATATHAALRRELRDGPPPLRRHHATSGTGHPRRKPPVASRRCTDCCGRRRLDCASARTPTLRDRRPNPGADTDIASAPGHHTAIGSACADADARLRDPPAWAVADAARKAAGLRCAFRRAPAGRPDRGVIARIRFEWDNHFVETSTASTNGPVREQTVARAARGLGATGSGYRRTRCDPVSFRGHRDRRLRRGSRSATS
jgi:hypothetical protein